MQALRRVLFNPARITPRATRLAPLTASRFSSTLEVPRNLFLASELEKPSQGMVSTAVGDLDPAAPASNVRSEFWRLYVSAMSRLGGSHINRPKKSTLHWLVTNAETREELDTALEMAKVWRMQMMPITQATAQIWIDSCIRLNYPELAMTMLLDQWTYRQLPVSYGMAKLIRFLGKQAKETGDEAKLDDAFRVFALYPYYNLQHDADAYGALVEACCEVNSEEAWRRALVVAEETLADAAPGNHG
ncbi:hypothetical protein DL89DRAFT_26283 [Linderina pennispora]|uniref:Uncharacterized protein n=1 Tax=Linderina pennispora TaxID=61395 RepID=A0A1Y1WPI9_9FUNG|nr:uncharacterized protein DL89DRAFT_26283 [Linderina pennispora]ORX75034.1 hypothetical protein DL89DRAFT_26283 [Linderina pennispora]